MRQKKPCLDHYILRSIIGLGVFLVSILAFEKILHATTVTSHHQSKKQSKHSNRIRVNLSAEKRNGDYLNHVATPGAEKSLNEELFGNKVGGELSERYKVISERLEHKQNYQLDSIDDQLRFQTDNRDLLRWTMRRLLQFHLQNQFKTSMKQASKNSSAVRNVTKSVTNLHQTVQSLQNTSVKLSTDTKARFKYDLPTGLVTVGLANPIADTVVNYRFFRVGANLDNPTTGIAAIDNQNNQNDKLSLSMSRNLDFLDNLGTSMNYGISDRRLNYGVNKKVFGPINAGLDQTQNLGDRSKSEVVGRLNLGTQF